MSQHVEVSLWYYQPSHVLPIIFMVLFFLSGIWHFYQSYRYKSWRITLFLPWAAFIMTAGFAMRLVGSYHIEDLGVLIASTVLVMSGPPVYAASNYLVLSRILFYVPWLSPMHPGRVLSTFIGLDLLIEVLVSNGAVRVANTSLTHGEREVGDIMVKVALITQAIIFISLIAMAIQFHVRASHAGVLTKKLRTVLWVLYTTSATVAVRCIYRIVEYFEGYEGVLLRHEFYFWIFEAALMFVTTLILNVWHPGKRLPRSNEVFLSQDGTERHGLGWNDKRNWVLTTFDPFDLVGLFKGRDKESKFWEMTPEEIERIEAERKRNKRPAWKTALDPFNLYGKNGRSTKGKKGSSEDASAVHQGMEPKRNQANGEEFV